MTKSLFFAPRLAAAPSWLAPRNAALVRTALSNPEKHAPGAPVTFQAGFYLPDSDQLPLMMQPIKHVFVHDDRHDAAAQCIPILERDDGAALALGATAFQADLAFDKILQKGKSMAPKSHPRWISCMLFADCIFFRDWHSTLGNTRPLPPGTQADKCVSFCVHRPANSAHDALTLQSTLEGNARIAARIYSRFPGPPEDETPSPEPVISIPTIGIAA